MNQLNVRLIVNIESSERELRVPEIHRPIGGGNRGEQENRAGVAGESEGLRLGSGEGSAGDSQREKQEIWCQR